MRGERKYKTELDTYIRRFTLACLAITATSFLLAFVLRGLISPLITLSAGLVVLWVSASRMMRSRPPRGVVAQSERASEHDREYNTEFDVYIRRFGLACLAITATTFLLAFVVRGFVSPVITLSVGMVVLRVAASKMKCSRPLLPEFRSR